MYQSIFDYQQEFRRCHSVLRKHHSTSVLEVGCGAGNLAKYFLDAGYDYMGMDVARPMLKIASRENPEARFVQGDMSRFRFPRKFDAVLIGGRSFAYMTSNEQVSSALQCIRRVLKPKGTLVFDNFDAEEIFKDLSKPMRDVVRIGTKTITRESKRSSNLKTGWTWNWVATYVIRDREMKRIFYDHSVLRAFTPDELRLFLTLAGFSTMRSNRGRGAIFTVARAI
jgi:SAM-dependent methyltransferase